MGMTIKSIGGQHIGHRFKFEKTEYEVIEFIDNKKLRGKTKDGKEIDVNFDEVEFIDEPKKIK